MERERESVQGFNAARVARKSRKFIGEFISALLEEREDFSCSTSLHQVWYKLQVRCNEKEILDFQHSFNNAIWSAYDTNSGQVCSQSLLLLLKVQRLRILRAISLDLNECQHVTFHTYASKSTKIECIHCNNLFGLKTLNQSIIRVK